jgi:hypothetical protein
MFAESTGWPCFFCRCCSSRTATKAMYLFVLRSSDPLRVFFSSPLHSLSRPFMSCSYVPAMIFPMRRVRDCLIIQYSLSVNQRFFTSFFFISDKGGIDLTWALRANDTVRLVVGESEGDSGRRRLFEDIDDVVFTLIESIIVDVFAFQNVWDWQACTQQGRLFFSLVL